MPDTDAALADDDERHALSHLLERLEATAAGDSVTVSEIAEGLGRRSFPALVLIPALLAVSPASGIPGLTAAVGLLVVLATSQMLWGRECLWLPGFLANRRIPTARLCQAVRWLRRPLTAVERFLRPRLTALVTRPLVALPLLVMLAIGLFMPLMEVVPTSGSVAAALVSLFATGLLTRDGALVAAALALSALAPFAVWQLAT